MDTTLILIAYLITLIAIPVVLTVISLRGEVRSANLLGEIVIAENRLLRQERNEAQERLGQSVKDCGYWILKSQALEADLKKLQDEVDNLRWESLAEDEMSPEEIEREAQEAFEAFQPEYDSYADWIADQSV